MPDQEWLTLKGRWGRLDVPANSLAAMALDPRKLEHERIERIERGSMPWSLGKFADLMWMVVPESRPIISDLARKELDHAVHCDEFLQPIRDTPLADSLYTDLLLPALNDVSAQEDMLRRCLKVFLRLIVEADSSYYWEVLELEVLRPLESKGGGALLAKLDPTLAEIRKQIQAARERNP